MSTAFETNAVWSATPLATDPTKIGAAGLSVRQRKLLTLLAQPMSVAQLADSVALPVAEVRNALDRFAKLGFAHSGAPASTPFDPMQSRATPNATLGVKETNDASPSRMPTMIGIAVATLALVAAAGWTLRGSSGSSAAPTPTPNSAVAAAQKAQTPTGSADSADTVLPRSAAAATSMPASLPASTSTPSAPVALSASAAKVALAESANVAATKVTAANVAAAATAAALIPAAATIAATTAATPAVAPTVTAVNQTAAPATASALTPATATATTAVAAPIAAIPVPAPAIAVAAPSVVAANTLAPATATPARVAPAVPREIKLLTRVEPQFPRGFDNDKGSVRARLQVDARGTVTGVDIVEANPPRVFDRSVRSALQQWRYEPTGEAFSTLAEISFSR